MSWFGYGAVKKKTRVAGIGWYGVKSAWKLDRTIAYSARRVKVRQSSLAIRLAARPLAIRHADQIKRYGYV